jgi:hypothetical protein
VFHWFPCGFPFDNVMCYVVVWLFASCLVVCRGCSCVHVSVFVVLVFGLRCVISVVPLEKVFCSGPSSYLAFSRASYDPACVFVSFFVVFEVSGPFLEFSFGPFVVRGLWEVDRYVE